MKNLTSEWLNQKDGTFLWQELHIGPNIRVEDMGQFPGTPRWNNYNNGYRQCTLPQGELGGMPVLLSLHFAPDGSLWAIYLTTRGEGDPKGWEDWSEAAELAVNERNDAWLAETLGPPPYRWPWGTIRSEYDARDGISIITLRYAATGARTMWVEVWFHAEGGRKQPPFGPCYRPHLVVDGGSHLGVEFEHLEQAPFGTRLRCRIRLPYDVDYFPLQPGAPFEIMEGRRRVGEGVVLPDKQ